MSPTAVSIPRRGYCVAGREQPEWVSDGSWHGDVNGRRSSPISSRSGGYGRMFSMNRIFVVGILYLMFIYGGVEPVDSFAVKQSLSSEENQPVSSEVSQSVEHYLAPQHDDGKIRIRRKATSGGRPATCTCSCETSLVSAATASSKSAENLVEEKLSKDTPASLPSQPSIVRGSTNGKHSPVLKNRNSYHHQLQPQHLSQLQKTQFPNVIDGVNDAVSADEPPKSAAVSSDASNESPASSFVSDYDEALGIVRHPPQNQYNDKALAELITNDVENFDSRHPGTWGHASRHPWLQLPNRMCFREPCTSDRQCCLDYNICDRSAQICTDCWYGNPCMSPRDCCKKYPNCQRPSTSSSPNGAIDGQNDVPGKCVD